MPPKPSDLLRRLPSASELLERPPVKALADRWNRSTVAAGVRSFLMELRSDLERRAGDVRLPPLRELAELAARYVASFPPHPVRPGINATGRFFTPGASGPPLADEALERLVAFGRGYLPASAQEAQGDVAAKLRQITGAEAALVASSYAGAVWLALAAVGNRQNAVIARRDVGEVEPLSTLSALAQAAGLTLREAGAVNAVSMADYEAAIDADTAAIVRHTPDFYHVAGAADAVELESLVGLARDRELPLVDLLGAAPLVDRLPALGAEWTSMAGSLAVGAQLVVARGDGLVGGPRSGIILGTRALIERIAAHPLLAAWQADAATCAALAATVGLYHDQSQLPQTVPLYQMLSASVENLRQRGERLAPQMAQAADVASAVVLESESTLGLAQVRSVTSPSIAVVLTPTADDESALDERLRQSAVPVLGRRESGRLWLDLRSVLPRQDQRLVEMVAAAAPHRALESEETPQITAP